MAGGLPDVLTVDGPNIAAYAANGIIQPLAELSEEEKSIYLPSIIDQGTYNDKLYALGVMESSVGLYYNKEILQEAVSTGHDFSCGRGQYLLLCSIYLVKRRGTGQ